MTRQIQSHPNNRRISQWVQKDILQSKIPVQVKKHSGGVSLMFWGVISRHGRGPLLAIQGSMDGAKYIEILRNELLPEIEYAREVFGADFKF